MSDNLINASKRVIGAAALQTSVQQKLRKSKKFYLCGFYVYYVTLADLFTSDEQSSALLCNVARAIRSLFPSATVSDSCLFDQHVMHQQISASIQDPTVRATVLQSLGCSECVNVSPCDMVKQLRDMSSEDLERLARRTWFGPGSLGPLHAPPLLERIGDPTRPVPMLPFLGYDLTPKVLECIKNGNLCPELN